MTNSDKNRSYWYLHIIAIVLILMALYVVVSYSLKAITRHNKELVVPDFTNKSLESALILAGIYDVRLDVTDSVYIQRMGRGMITKQNPKPGSKVKKNRRILLTINSINPKQSYVPSLIGYSLRQAKTELVSRGLSIGKLIYQDDMATNIVLSQMYNEKDIEPETVINAGTEIDLVLGMNRSNNRTFIPVAYGYTFIPARDMLIDSYLNIDNVYFDKTVSSYSDSLNAVVYRMEPAPSNNVSYKMGRGVQLYLTLDKSKKPIIKK